MTILTFLMLASLVGAAVYLILSARLSDVLIGIGLLSNGVNILLIESDHPSHLGADPLPRALILTALVIGFALVTFLAGFVLQHVQYSGSDAINSNEEHADS